MPGFQSTRLATDGALEPFYFLYTDDSIQGNPETCKQSSIMLNYEIKNIEGDVLSFLFCELKLPDIYKKYKNIYLSLVNLLLIIQHKHLFIIIDAINENDSDGFGSNITEFINEITRYSRINIIVSCRNEYYKERFRKHLVENVDILAFEFDLKEQHYTLVAINQIIRAYSKFFNYGGNIAPTVRNTLSKQLLLLRIFFEVNKGSNVDVFMVLEYK